MIGWQNPPQLEHGSGRRGQVGRLLGWRQALLVRLLLLLVDPKAVVLVVEPREHHRVEVRLQQPDLEPKSQMASILDVDEHHCGDELVLVPGIGSVIGREQRVEALQPRHLVVRFLTRTTMTTVRIEKRNGRDGVKLPVHNALPR